MKQKIIAIVNLLLLIFWAISALSGIILWLAPEGRRAGRVILFLGIPKHQWVEFHTLFSFLALGISLIHVIIYWKILSANIKNLIKH